MLVTIICLDKPGSLELRMKTRPAHHQWAKDSKAPAGVFMGPILGDDGETLMGSVYVAEFPDLAAARAYQKSDPYEKVGLFERVIVQPTRVASLPK